MTFIYGHCVRRTTLSRTETFGATLNDVVTWENVGPFLVGFRGRFELCVVIQNIVARLLYDIWNNLPLCGWQ